MTTAVLTPATAKASSRLGGRLFRKPVLPRGKAIDYTDPITGQTRKLEFSDEMLTGIIDSFDKGAYDTVKFQLADAANTHTLDPQRARGTIRGFELTADTLDMLVEATPDGEKVISENPDLPVSARIVEGLKRADGQQFSYAIQHVLGTLDPRISGLGGWQAVDLANDPDVPTVDLTAADYTPKENTMSDQEKTSVWAKIGKALGLADNATEDEVAASVAERLTAAPVGDEEPQLTAEEIAALEALANEPQPAEASLTADAQRQIDLANANAEQANARAAALEQQARRNAWQAEYVQRLHAGTPKALLDLAAPWCGGDTPTGFIDLANTDTTVESVRDAAAADMRRMLDEHKGFIDLSVIGEAPEADEEAAAARQAAVKAHRQAAGF